MGPPGAPQDQSARVRVCVLISVGGEVRQRVRDLWVHAAVGYLLPNTYRRTDAWCFTLRSAPAVATPI